MERSGSAGSAVVAIEADEWGGCNGEAAAPLRMGDILEEITFGGSPPARAPFKGGRDAVMTLLHAAFQRGDSSVLVRARRGERSAAPYLELHACIVPHPPAGRRQFLILSIRDPNYPIALVDRSESECTASQGENTKNKKHELEEGFIYVSSVTDDDSAGASAARTRLRELYKRAATASKLLVVSRVGNEKVLLWMVSTWGVIRCFDTVSLSQKLSLHRHALKPVLLHLLMRDASASAVARVPCSGAKAGGPTAAPQHSMSRHPSEEEAVTPRLLSLAPPSPADEVSSDAMIGRYVVGEVSSRFRYSNASSD
ncbi:hypothetical protein MUK42_24892 [Musa troglodytarum]|uniref:Uncharacterized protein n=1 Tax=Musa troglodytarum TaxID=320322 RepID=A0A9E7JCB1_9LILI|nr:hypothetical protein MUK42_24892 [Musa troglodytarum]